jgi:methanogen extracellular protein (TIGR04279 family)
MGKQTLLLLMIYLCSAASFGLEDSSEIKAAGAEGVSIKLESADNLIIPEVGLIRPDGRWSYHFGSYPIITEGRNISGTFLATEQMSGTEVRLQLAGFSIHNFLSPQMALNKSISSNPEEAIRLNLTGAGDFTLRGLPGGLFSLFALDCGNQTLLSALLLLVVTDDLALEMPDNVTAGNVIDLKARIKPGNESRVYGAIMISLKNYRNASLITSTDGQSINSTISLGERSENFQGVPSISRDFLMTLFSLLPANSAIGMVESNQSEVSLNLITDQEWERGDYILTAAAYSHGRITSIGQRIVEVE